MLNFVFRGHSDLRYAVLTLALVTVLYALWGFVKKQPVGRGGLNLLRVFTIVLDVQFLLGLMLLFLRPFYPQLIGHLVMMIGAIAVAHLGLVRLKKTAPEARSYGVMLAAAAVPLLLIIGGILAIQRPIL